MIAFDKDPFTASYDPAFFQLSSERAVWCAAACRGVISWNTVHQKILFEIIVKKVDILPAQSRIDRTDPVVVSQTQTKITEKVL